MARGLLARSHSRAKRGSQPEILRMKQPLITTHVAEKERQSQRAKQRATTLSESESGRRSVEIESSHREQKRFEVGTAECDFNNRSSASAAVSLFGHIMQNVV
eukprot:8830285-Pyramimonas_sp.AAC.1